MDIAPGSVIADVEDGQTYRPTVRVRTYSNDTWIQIIDTLQERLSSVGGLMEGVVDERLLNTLAERGLDLHPEASEIDGDCDCGDYAVPCAHAAAVHHVLAEALQGEPFLLFALRGRPREQLLADLRRSWGDTGSTTVVDDAPAALPEGDWLAAPRPLPPMTFKVSDPARFPGHVELGPLGGEDDVGRTLAPLYTAGAQAARELALHRPTARLPRRRRHGSVAPPPEPAQPTRPATTAERIVELLAVARSGVRAADLATELSVPVRTLRRTLKELEDGGQVTRTGATRGTRWWLG